MPETVGKSESAALVYVGALIPQTLVLVDMLEGAALESVGMSINVTSEPQALVTVGKSASAALVFVGMSMSVTSELRALVPIGRSASAALVLVGT